QGRAGLSGQPRAAHAAHITRRLRRAIAQTGSVRRAAQAVRRRDAGRGKRLTTLLNDFLDLQRIESGRQQLSQVSLHLASLVERAAATISDADHPITVDLPDWLPAVQGDPDRLQQVLSNLLSNAKKYSPDGGEIVISGRS